MRVDINGWRDGGGKFKPGVGGIHAGFVVDANAGGAWYRGGDDGSKELVAVAAAFVAAKPGSDVDAVFTGLDASKLFGTIPCWVRQRVHSGRIGGGIVIVEDSVSGRGAVLVGVCGVGSMCVVAGLQVDGPCSVDPDPGCTDRKGVVLRVNKCAVGVKVTVVRRILGAGCGEQDVFIIGHSVPKLG